MELNKPCAKHRSKTFLSSNTDSLDQAINKWFDTLSRDITIIDIKYNFTFRPDSHSGMYICSALIHYTTMAVT